MIIEINSLTKNYGKKRALDKFSYKFEPGIYAILGPNGAGKSTLVNLIADNLKRTAGEILCDSTEILKLGVSYRKQIGIMPQSQGMYENMTAFEFLMYMAYVKGLKRKKAKKQVKELIERVNLSDAAHKQLRGFSGGMKQRVLLAQALLGDPKLIMLDEPTAGLDPEERVRLRNYISNLGAEKIVIITTHITADVESIADHVLIIDKGHLICSQSPEALVESVDAENLEDAYIKALHSEVSHE